MVFLPKRFEKKSKMFFVGVFSEKDVSVAVFIARECHPFQLSEKYIPGLKIKEFFIRYPFTRKVMHKYFSL